MDFLEKIKQLHPVTFKWTEEAQKEFRLDDKKQIGLIAQEVEKIFPELIAPIRRGMKTVRYSWLWIYLLRAIQEQQKEIEELKKKVSR